MAENTPGYSRAPPAATKPAITAVNLAVKMQLHNKTRLGFTTAAISLAFFLVVAQFGLLVGWIRMNSAIIDHAGVALWVMARQTPAFDYGTGIPWRTIFRARNIPGVARAEGMVQGWANWQCPDGRRVNVEVIGLDQQCLGGPWAMHEGTVSAVHWPDAVLVDALSCAKLGVNKTGAAFEIEGRRAVVEGICMDVRSFTASPFVFTSLDASRRFDRRFADDEIAFVLVRCEPSADVAGVQLEMRRRMPELDVLTTAQFARRTVKYWMLETGAGITVVVTALLGLVVGTLIMSQTLFATTQDHRANYAMLLAVGFERRQLGLIVLAQSLVFGLLGIAGGSILFFPASAASASSPIPIETTPLVFAALATTALASCLAASLMSVRTIFNIDPVAVFHQ
jgi:putative ABC transport system permease protein